jgi:hypothetical protein
MIINLTIEEFFDDNFPPDIITDEYFESMGFYALPIKEIDWNSFKRELCIWKYRCLKQNSLPVDPIEVRKGRKQKIKMEYGMV